MVQDGPIQRKKKNSISDSGTKTKVDDEDKPKPPFIVSKPYLDENQKKNLKTLINFMLPCCLAIYLGIILQGYSVKEFNPLVTNKYFLLGFKDIEALKKALVANFRDSAIWGVTYLYVRRWGNPEFRPRTSTFVQDGYFGSLSSFATTLVKQVINNFT